MGKKATWNREHLCKVHFILHLASGLSSSEWHLWLPHQIQCSLFLLEGSGSGGAKGGVEFRKVWCVWRAGRAGRAPPMSSCRPFPSWLDVFSPHAACSAVCRAAPAASLSCTAVTFCAAARLRRQVGCKRERKQQPSHSAGWSYMSWNAAGTGAADSCCVSGWKHNICLFTKKKKTQSRFVRGMLLTLPTTKRSQRELLFWKDTHTNIKSERKTNI